MKMARWYATKNTCFNASKRDAATKKRTEHICKQSASLRVSPTIRSLLKDVLNQIMRVQKNCVHLNADLLSAGKIIHGETYDMEHRKASTRTNQSDGQLNITKATLKRVSAEERSMLCIEKCPGHTIEKFCTTWHFNRWIQSIDFDCIKKAMIEKQKIQSEVPKSSIRWTARTSWLPKWCLKTFVVQSRMEYCRPRGSNNWNPQQCCMSILTTLLSLLYLPTLKQRMQTMIIVWLVLPVPNELDCTTNVPDVKGNDKRDFLIAKNL
jgi:hypothetical protein